MAAFKQPNSLRNLLVRVEISKPNTTIGKSHSCGDKRCKCCRHMQHSSSYTSKVTGKQYNILCIVNGKSASVIYTLECSVCGLQYVDESKYPFHKRMNRHRSDLTKKSFLPVNQHFRLSDYSLEDFKRMKILIIEHSCLWSDFFNVRIGKDFGLKNSVFYILTVLTENNSFLYTPLYFHASTKCVFYI